MCGRLYRKPSSRRLMSAIIALLSPDHSFCSVYRRAVHIPRRRTVGIAAPSTGHQGEVWLQGTGSGATRSQPCSSQRYTFPSHVTIIINYNNNNSDITQFSCMRPSRLKMKSTRSHSSLVLVFFTIANFIFKIHWHFSEFVEADDEFLEVIKFAFSVYACNVVLNVMSVDCVGNISVGR